MSYFNSDQESYMEFLSSVAPERKCWCGWFMVGACPNCPPALTLAAKKAVWCKDCHNAPANYGTGILTHNKSCPSFTRTNDHRP